MLNVLKLLLAAAFILSPSNSFATQTKNQTQSVTIKAGPCVHLHNPFRCNNYPTGECFWDEADQRCENRNNNEDRCSQIYSRYSCINSPFGCFWDYDDQRCERR